MTDQPLYAALDVSLEKTTVCIMAFDGSLIQEAVVPSDPTALAACLEEHRDRLKRIGLEAGPLSEWIVRGLADRPVAARERPRDHGGGPAGEQPAALCRPGQGAALGRVAGHPQVLAVAEPPTV